MSPSDQDLMEGAWSDIDYFDRVKHVGAAQERLAIIAEIEALLTEDVPVPEGLISRILELIKARGV